MNIKQQNAFIKLAGLFAEKLGVENPTNIEFTEREQLIEAISKKNIAISNILDSLQTDFGSFYFVKNDAELVMKMKPIWDMETTRLKALVAESVGKLENSASELGLEINEPIDIFRI